MSLTSMDVSGFLHVELRVLRIERRGPLRSLRALVRDPDGNEFWVAPGDTIHLTIRLKMEERP